MTPTTKALKQQKIFFCNTSVST